MITYLSGNLLDDSADALVNTVNCVGVMGKGIALAFKGAYPENFTLYKAACERRYLKPGGLFASETGLMFGPKQILNVATKDDWRNPSRIVWIESAAPAIRRHCETRGLTSVAVPALGCANGGLPWNGVRAILEDAFRGSAVDFRIYLPLGR